MSFEKLYERVQEQSPGRIKTSWLRDQVIDLTPIHGVKEQWTGVIDPSVIRGFYIEGPMGPPVPLQRQEVLIVLARSLSRELRRYVYTKELMHAFDSDGEKADTAEKFDRQIERLGDPNAPTSDQFRAEQKAMIRALGVLCTEGFRSDLRCNLVGENLTIDMVATRLKLPIWATDEMMRTDFEDLLKHVM